MKRVKDVEQTEEYFTCASLQTKCWKKIMSHGIYVMRGHVEGCDNKTKFINLVTFECLIYDFNEVHFLD